ncbi:ImmA/IrrE family metallo-endopeptidase [Xanthomonas campestris pv. phormiicola]|nr:ImmA/IrrE family metallo-endopeptidase [Xanthomonas campestris pv. phormiicola]UYC15765.1 ImmA/IrrE family metallo-endopeptidase [Xanthomonas campestris pv. phormiicola]
MNQRTNTRSVGNFVPDRLSQALSVRGFSATELAARIGVTNTTISRWRTGSQAPSPTMLEAMASELRVAPEWLTRPLRNTTSKPNYRGSIAQLKQERGLLGARMEWLEEASSQLEEFVDYPAVNLPSFDLRRLAQITDSVVEEAADACRKLWNLGEGPVGDTLLLLENAGAVVALEETGIARIEGLSAWSTSGRPFVLLCADKGNAFRSRFDAAHELGHLVLHRHIEAPGDAASHKLMEQQAHRFAGAFLLPARGFVAEVSTPVSLQALVFLKQRWGVSVAAMIMRLRALGVISEEDYLRLIKHRSAKWGNKREPLDDERTPEEPRLLRRTMELLINEGVIRADGLADMLGISARDVESMFGLPIGYLSGKKADIVELAIKRRELTDVSSSTIADSTSNVVLFDRFRK